MATFYTLAQLRSRVQVDLDLEDEDFITDSELDGYINDGIDEAEAEIHSLYEDYFLTKTSLALVSGTEEYSMPTGIYGHKIRRIVYRSGSTVYPIERIRDWKKFEEYALENVNQSSTRYAYFIINSTAGSPKILLSPPAKETSASNVTIWYIRNANRLSIDADICDIPEFSEFVLQFAKVRCYEKEGHPMLEKAMADLEARRIQMVGTLANMIPDDADEIEADMTFYYDMV